MNERNEPLRSLAAGMQSLVSAKLGDIWWAFMLRGVFAGVLGIFALIWPTLTFTILTRMIGLYCLADGLPGLVGALRASDRGTYLAAGCRKPRGRWVSPVLAQHFRPNPTHGLRRLGALHRSQQHLGRSTGKRRGHRPSPHDHYGRGGGSSGPGIADLAGNRRGSHLVDHCSGGSAVSSAPDLPGATPQAVQEAGRQTRAATTDGIGQRQPVSGHHFPQARCPSPRRVIQEG